MSPSVDNPAARQARCYDALLQLLAIDATRDLVKALNDAATLICRVLGADKVDVYLHEPSAVSLVSVAASGPIAIQQRSVGLDRRRLGDGGLTVRVFQSGRNHLSGNLDREPNERAEVSAALGLRSAAQCRIHTNGSPRGVLEAASVNRNWFSESDLRFLEGAADWMGLVTRRAELADQIAHAAMEAGKRRAAGELQWLTPREREVAVLVASGMTNEEIAERLVVVRGTISNHIVHILRKLGFNRRVQIAAWAVQLGLWRPDRH